MFSSINSLLKISNIIFSFVKCLFYNFWKDHMDILLSFINEGLCSVFAVVSNSVWPMNSSPPEPSIHGILQVRIPEWVAMPSSRWSSQPWDPTRGVSCIFCIAVEFFTPEPAGKPESEGLQSLILDNVSVFPRKIFQEWFINLLGVFIYMIIYTISFFVCVNVVCFFYVFLFVKWCQSHKMS